jgi:hypothetical protein
MQNVRVENQTGDRRLARAFPTFVYGGLAVGLLDGIAALVNAGIRGVSPVRVFQYISSSLLGPESFERGTTTVILGIVLHFLVAFGVAFVFYLIARSLPIVLDRPIISGVVYGIAVYFAMAYLIVPLSAVRQGPFSWDGLVVSLIIHILFVGLPVALISRRYAD